MYLFTKHGFEAPKEFLASLKGKNVKNDIPFFFNSFFNRDSIGKTKEKQIKACMYVFIHSFTNP
jgi:hypothetical protein